MSDDKEQREHAHVISAIANELHPHCESDPQVGQTTIRTLRNVHHLCTPIAARLKQSTHLLDLVAACIQPGGGRSAARSGGAVSVNTGAVFARSLRGPVNL